MEQNVKLECHNHFCHYVVWDKYSFLLSILYESRCDFLEIMY